MIGSTIEMRPDSSSGKSGADYHRMSSWVRVPLWALAYLVILLSATISVDLFTEMHKPERQRQLHMLEFELQPGDCILDAKDPQWHLVYNQCAEMRHPGMTFWFKPGEYKFVRGQRDPMHLGHVMLDGSMYGCCTTIDLP